MRKDRSKEVQALISQALSAAQTARTAAAPTVTPDPAFQGLREPHTDHFNTSPEGISEAAMNSAIQKLIAASGGKISITSGKRSTKRQAELWAQALKKYGSPEKARKWVAPPGRSKHEHGLANDLKFADPTVRAWAHQNAAKFGLVFPLSNEPWHVELRGARK